SARKIESVFEMPGLSATAFLAEVRFVRRNLPHAASDANRADRLWRLDDEPCPGGDETRARDARKHAPGGNDLFGQHQDRQCGDPTTVHHAPDEEQRHQRPAATDAVAAMAEAERERAPARNPPWRWMNHNGAWQWRRHASLSGVH